MEYTYKAKVTSAIETDVSTREFYAESDGDYAFLVRVPVIDALLLRVGSEISVTVKVGE